MSKATKTPKKWTWWTALACPVLVAFGLWFAIGHLGASAGGAIAVVLVGVLLAAALVIAAVVFRISMILTIGIWIPLIVGSWVAGAVVHYTGTAWFCGYLGGCTLAAPVALQWFVPAEDTSARSPKVMPKQP